jgi:hypothetical protein
MQASNEEVRRNRELEYRAYVGVKTATLVPQKDSPDFGITILLDIDKLVQAAYIPCVRTAYTWTNKWT